MTSQKGAPVVLGVKRGTPRAPSPSMQSEGKPLHASPPSWPGCAHWLRGWAPMRSASKTCARSATSLDPQHGVVVMETWRQCIRSIVRSMGTHNLLHPPPPWKSILDPPLDCVFMCTFSQLPFTYNANTVEPRYKDVGYNFYKQSNFVGPSPLFFLTLI